MKAEDNVMITKLEIKIEGKKCDITVEQARKLYLELKQLFSEPKAKLENEDISMPKYDAVYGDIRYTWHGTNTSPATLSMEVK